MNMMRGKKEKELHAFTELSVIRYRNVKSIKYTLPH